MRLPLRALNRKLVREVWRLRAQMLSIALVVAAGIATVVLFRSTFDSLEESRDAYYRDSRFADVFASLKRAPEPLAARLARIPGVEAVQTRVSLGITLDVPGLTEPATGLVVSLPTQGGAELNLLHVLRGRPPRPDGSGEAMVNEHFALANELEIGDSIGAVINGRWERIEIVGVALSPEYVYAASPGAFITDDRRFGVLWMPRRALAAAYAMDGAFNDVALQLGTGASRPAVIAAVDRLLEPYGGFGAYERADQPSNRIVEDEVRQNRATGTIIPGLILAIAAFLLNLVLGRLITTEREQIALLKAFGYTDIDVGRHYLQYALVAVLMGAAIGIGVGLWLGESLIGVYGESFRFPVLEYRASWPLVAGAVLISILAAAAGALGAVRRAIRLPPAEAMRPESPARFGHGIIERVIPFPLTPVGLMVVRTLTRRPVRTAVSVLGVGFSVSLLVVVLLFYAAFTYSFDLQFGVAQRQDVTLMFNAIRSASVRHDLAHLPGVERVEGFRAVPVRLRVGHRSRELALMGLEPSPRLSRIVKPDGRDHPLPADGLVLSEELARVLGAVPGDTILAEVLEGRRPLLRIPLAATVEDFFGVSAYIALPALNRRLREAPSLSGAHLAVNGERLDETYAELKRMPSVAGVTSPASMLAYFDERIARNIGVNLAIISAFAGVIAIGVIYNSARIALSEAGRELASLRVLGFTRHEIGVILLGEQAVVTILGLPVGAGLGILYAALWIESLSGEAYRIPLIFPASAFVIAGAVILGMAALAGVLVRRRLDHLDLIAVLKTRE